MSTCHYFVWDDHEDFLVTVHAVSVVRAREMALQAIEDSTFYEPVRSEVQAFVEKTMPFIYHGEQAHVACRASKMVVDQREDLRLADQKIAELCRRLRSKPG